MRLSIAPARSAINEAQEKIKPTIFSGVQTSAQLFTFNLPKLVVAVPGNPNCCRQFITLHLAFNSKHFHQFQLTERMERQIAADELLDSVECRISPDDRYYVFIYCGDKEEKVGSSLIAQLTAHLHEGLYSDSKGSYADFKLESPENLCDATWFTKNTVTRFLELIDSPDALKKIFAMSNEMLQLEETKKFHLSLHRQEELYTNSLMNDEAVLTDVVSSSRNYLLKSKTVSNANIRHYCSDGDEFTYQDMIETDCWVLFIKIFEFLVNFLLGDPIIPDAIILYSTWIWNATRNELLRAMDLRLSALGDELVAAFNQAGGSTSSREVILNLEKFCKHVGAADLSNVLSKLLGMNLITINPPNEPTKCVLTTANKMEDNARILTTLYIDQPVIYGASPAKAAEMERQSCTSGEDSSSSSEEDWQSAERSRNMSRSATPRRSASPMRRIQIGRSGSRRTPAIAIKSLSYFPGREKTFSLKDAASNDGETDRFVLPSKAAESNDRRMSVQDAISLFERKQRDQTTDTPKWKTQADNPANASKSVLRRWSSTVDETSAQCSDQSAYEQNLHSTSNDLLDEAPSNSSAGVQPITDILPCPPESKTAAAQACQALETSKQNSASPNDAEIPVIHSEGAGEKLDSVEWSRKKEAELNQMLMSFVQSKPSKYRNIQAADSKKLDSGTGKNKERKNQKLQAENIGKKTDTRAQPRAMPKALDKVKSEMSSTNMGNIGKKQPVGKTQKEKFIKSIPLSSSSKRESPRPVVSKGPSKPSPLPATRKSWPLSTPNPRATVSSKTPIGTPTSATIVPRQKSQSPASFSRLSPKLETPQQKKKDVRNTQVDIKKSSKSIDKSKGQVAPRSVKGKKTEAAASLDSGARVPGKPNLPKKVAKKSTVVPLEPRASIRKASGEKTPAISKKAPVASPPVKERLSKSEVVAENAVPVEEIELDATVSDPVIEHFEELEVAHVEPVPVGTPTADVKVTSSDKVYVELDENIEAEIQPEEEEAIISPLAWVESGDQDSPPHVSGERTCQVARPTNLAAVASASAGSRVRHSLSQMLLEESSEPDIIEWGNAEIPPAMIYQKDAPKGLKRLLKFARKNRGETNIGSAWSSPYTSEGEDDSDESKGFGKKNSDSSLLRKAALKATQHGQYGISSDGHDRILADSEPLSARSNASNNSFQSTTSTTSRASRSFFSLSAFRGNKGAETKMR
ncbi:hypothetical protein V2J09_017509 [Rumex salicifolius]